MRKTQQSPVATVRSVYPELTPFFQRRKEEEGYASLSDYFFWLAVYDVLLRRPHHLSAHGAHLSADRQEDLIHAVIANFDSPKKPGSLFEARLQAVALEENYRLHGQIRELKDRVRELEIELAREKSQGKLG